MKLKHYPGPWEFFIEKNIVSENCSIFRNVVRTVNGKINLATGHYDDELVLMAAAPEMLDALIVALRNMLNLTGNIAYKEHKQIIEVIEKATGMKIHEVLADD